MLVLFSPLNKRSVAEEGHGARSLCELAYNPAESRLLFFLLDRCKASSGHGVMLLWDGYTGWPSSDGHDDAASPETVARKCWGTLVCEFNGTDTGKSSRWVNSVNAFRRSRRIGRH